MKVFVTGATGALGKSVVPLLVAAGHDVRGAARTDEKAAWLRAQGAEAVSVDLFDASSVKDAVTGCDAVAHLATNVPAGAKAVRPKNWAMHNRLRAEATPLLVDAALATGAQVFVKESICFFYEDGGDRVLDEDAPLVDGPLADPTYVGEHAVDRITEAGGRGVVLRFGLFYGPNARMIDEWLKLAKLGRTTIAGKPDGYQPSIHLDDAAAAMVAALDAPAGIYNISEEALTKGEYLHAFAHAFGLKRAPKPTPEWMLKMVAGKNARYLVGSQRVSSARFHEATGWSPQHATAREGWVAVAAAREGSA